MKPFTIEAPQSVTSAISALQTLVRRIQGKSKTNVTSPATILDIYIEEQHEQIKKLLSEVDIYKKSSEYWWIAHSIDTRHRPPSLARKEDKQSPQIQDMIKDRQRMIKNNELKQKKVLYYQRKAESLERQLAEAQEQIEMDATTYKD